MTTNSTDKPRYVTEHLTELRRGLVKSLIAAGIGVIAAFWKSDWLFAALVGPFRAVLSKFPEMSGQVHTLQTLAPIEAFMINMKLATIAGMALASPFILREIWVFASPALKSNERFGLLMVFFLGLFFFSGGVAFGYFLVVPLALQFLVHYNLDYHFLPQWTLQGYFSFVLNFLLIFGLVFELPLILAALVSIGVATPAFLAQKRKHAIVGIFILSAFIAPSADPITQTIVAVPLVFLYEVGILLSYLAIRKRS
jgi:sec-independent protein translocase protein TatC